MGEIKREGPDRRFFGQWPPKNPVELRVPPLTVEFIDEHSAQQPYVQHGELERYLDLGGEVPNFDVTSDEGFAHNDQLQAQTGASIARLLNLAQIDQPVLEVGWGTNHHFAQGIHSESGLAVDLLDFQSSAGLNNKNPPRRGEILQSGLHTYLGDVEDLDETGSDLKQKRFSSAIFNGSWSAGGNNWTTKHILEAHYANKYNVMNIDWKSPQFQNFMDQHLDGIMRLLKGHLSPNGTLFVASPRYAYHGAGYTTDQLPQEKLEMLDVLERAKRLGAKGVKIIGVSSDGLRKMLAYNLQDENTTITRRRQIFYELFVVPYGDATRYTLSNPEGKEYRVSQLLDLFQDPNEVQRLMAIPDLRALVDDELLQHIEFGEKLMDRLSGGIEALASLPDDYYISPKRKSAIKKNLNGNLPPAIGRIDAIAIQF